MSLFKRKKNKTNLFSTSQTESNIENKVEEVSLSSIDSTSSSNVAVSDEEQDIEALNASSNESETWYFNDSLTDSLDDTSVSFISNGENYVSMSYTGSRPRTFKYYSDSTNYTIVYNSSDESWTDAYRTVTFDTSPTGDLLTWLQANATKQETTTKKLLKVNNKVVYQINKKSPLKVNNTLVSGGRLVNWVEPEQEGTKLTLAQAYSATQTDNVLEIK